MFLLTKAFKLRDKVNNDGHEKPFLEHLEDLRVMITRILITLMVSTLLCYFFKDTLMDVLRRPIEAVWEQNQQSKLPEKITPDTWELAKITSQHAASLSPDDRAAYFAQFDSPELAFYSQCAAYYRAARSIDGYDKQIQFINSLPDIEPKEKELTLSLLEDKDNLVNPDIGARDRAVHMRSLKPTETFMLSLKLAFFAGIIISFPFILIFILQFVLPGLKEQEKKALWPAMAIGFGLFLAGVFFCYFIVLPKALEFFYVYSGSMGVENEWRIGEYITFATQFTLIFGLAFELPVVVMTLVKLGILDYEVMSRTRSYAIVSIFIIAAIITPTGDALTLCMLAAPMTLLYEACIWFAYFTRKKELEEEAAERATHAPRIATAPGSLAALEAEENHLAEEVDEEYDYADDHPEDEDEGEEFDNGVIAGEAPPSALDTLRAPYDPHATSAIDHDLEEKHDGQCSEGYFDDDHFIEDHFDHEHFEEEESLDQGAAAEDLHLAEAVAKLEELRAKIKELEENALTEKNSDEKNDSDEHP
ncbi:twin-arginine translocase subunit TatC [Rubritalea spongiae]|uniref:Sec-independent protein translocase protein TatC n=1 Tax=Rubritalea spongiae TaxID=430797 RepID=A0ABW5DZP2_9BACT